MTSAQRLHRKQYLSCQAFTILYYKVQVDWTLGTDLLIDIFFMADIALNFNTGFISDQARPVCCCLSMRTASANHHQSSHAASYDTWSAAESIVTDVRCTLCISADMCTAASEFGHGAQTGSTEVYPGLVYA